MRMDFKDEYIQVTGEVGKLTGSVLSFLKKFFESLNCDRGAYHDSCVVFSKYDNNSYVFSLILKPIVSNDYCFRLIVNQTSIVIHFNGWHENFVYGNCGEIGQFLSSLEQFLVSVLSGQSYLKVYWAAREPYKWELLNDAVGRFKTSTGLLIFNYFGHRTTTEERICLVPALNRADPSQLLKYV